LTQIDVEEYAGFGRRLISFIIDLLICLIFFVTVYSLFNSGFNEQASNKSDEIQILFFQNWFEELICIFVVVFMWVKFLGTPGKLLLGCHVVDAETKQHLTISQALVRYVGYFASLLPLGLGFFWVIWDKRKQGFHDKLAKSVVIVESAHWGEDESQKTLEELVEESK